MLKKYVGFFKTARFKNLLVYSFFAITVVSIIGTYLLFSHIDLYSENTNNVLSFLYFDIACVIILIFLGIRKLVTIWNKGKNQSSRLTLKLVTIFSIISVIPSVVMCVFSALFFHNGIESWLVERNRTALKESLEIASSYLDENKKRAIKDCNTISKTLEYHFYNFDMNSVFLEKNSNEIAALANELCLIKGVDSAILLDSELHIVASSKYSASLHFLNVQHTQLESLKNNYGESSIIKTDGKQNEKIITASCFYNGGKHFFLITEKSIDSNVLVRANRAKNAYKEYNDLRTNRHFLEMAFILVFLIVGVLLLIISIAIGVVYSWKIVDPISNLIDTSKKIIDGDIQARANVKSSYSEITLLSSTFNNMISKVYEQQNDLININKLLDAKMKFLSSVLAGVSSGVIGISNNKIYTCNEASEKLIAKDITLGDDINDTLPEISGILESIDDSNQYIEKEVQVNIKNRQRLFLIKVSRIGAAEFVITLDDITNMMIEQRKIAWTEVARRVAHEIKNPLTPIQLSAERIKRKYINQITKDVDVFSKLVDVIIKQVGDIKRLVDEFSFFSRLPEPILKVCDLCDICSQAVFLMKDSSDGVSLIFNAANKKIFTYADERLIHQCIVNLIKNAINAILFSKKNGNVSISVYHENEQACVSVEDDGPGFPKDKIESLTNPYFTLMPKGTGLGLAIVKKIIQDHNGKLLFDESKMGGARVVFSIPVVNDQGDA